MKKILIEFDERMVTRYGFIYFGFYPAETGLQFILPPTPACLPGFDYVTSKENPTFRISEITEPAAQDPAAAGANEKGG